MSIDPTLTRSQLRTIARLRREAIRQMRAWLESGSGDRWHVSLLSPDERFRLSCVADREQNRYAWLVRDRQREVGSPQMIPASDSRALPAGPHVGADRPRQAAQG